MGYPHLFPQAKFQEATASKGSSEGKDKNKDDGGLLYVLLIDLTGVTSFLRPRGVVSLGMTRREFLSLLHYRGRWICPTVEFRLTNVDAVFPHLCFRHLRSLRIWTRGAFRKCQDILTDGTLRQLQTVTMCGCSFGGEDFEQISNLRSASLELNVFNVERNALTDDLLYTMLLCLPSSVTTLCLRYNRLVLRSDDFLPCIPLLCRMHLRVLNLRMNCVSDAGVALLLPLLQRGLEILNLAEQRPA